MADISPNYASPGLRWSLLLEDHPRAKSDYTIETGTDLGIPADQGGDQDFIVCTITFGPGSDREPAVGWKRLNAWPLKRDGTRIAYEDPSDVVDINRTKARGRALKNAGYPADMKDLLASMSWRRRNRELDALAAGHAALTLEEAKPERALEAAGKKDGAIEVEEVQDGDGDGDTVSAPEERTADAARPADDESDDVPAGDEDEADLDGAPTDPTMERLRETINLLNDEGRSTDLTKIAREKGVRFTRPRTEGDARWLIEEGRKLLGAEPAAAAEPSAGTEPAAATPVEASPPADEDPSEELVAEIVELVAGLSDAETHAYKVFVRDINADPDMPGKWTGDQRREVYGWLKIGED